MPGSRHGAVGLIGLRRSLLPLCMACAVTLVARAEPALAGEGTFVYRLISDPISLDPAKSNRIQDDQVMWLLYDALTQLSTAGTKMEPAPAARREQRAAGLPRPAAQRL